MGVKIGYMAVTDAWTPTECLRQAREAERIGFDALWVEDHFTTMPGGTNCNFAWTVMSSALQVTDHVPFITGVTAPIMRYHPAIVAQAFATMGAMYPGRVGIGVGTGEPPNEMALRSDEFPSNATRLEMLEEAITIMNTLWTSTEPVSFAGEYYTLNNAVILTKPEKKVPVWVSAIGPRAAEVAGRLGDHLISFANNPQYVREELFPTFEAAASEAGKDPKTMERTVLYNYIYDPDQLVPLESIQQDSGTVSGGAMFRAMSSGIMALLHSADDFIKKTEELKRMGYEHIVVINSTAGGKLHGIPLDEAASLTVWEDVLPHVR